MERYCIPDILNHWVRAVNNGETSFNCNIDRMVKRDHSHFHMSETFKCHRYRIMQRAGAVHAAKDDLSLRRFVLGDTVERMVFAATDYVKANIASYADYKFHYQIPVRLVQFDLVGHLDLLIEFPDGSVDLWDVKSCLQSKIDYVKRGEKDETYEGQVSAYRMGMALPDPDRTAFPGGVKIANAGICYIEKGVLMTHPEIVSPGVQDKVLDDYNRLMLEWSRYQKDRIIPAEVPLERKAEHNRMKDGKRIKQPAGMYPNWACDKRYCSLIANCPAKLEWWASHPNAAG